MVQAIMIQGTMSNVGKSIITAGLCRIFKQDGYRVAPFKSQNMALNSYVTKEGLEMGRAQVLQAQACGLEPSVDMNPILLKPTTDMGSQVIINGLPIGNMNAMEYFRHKKEYIPYVMDAYNRLAADNDIIVIEGAGSPAEINLKADDIVNMGMAELVDAPVLLVGDIDRGGVFAQLIGTIDLLEDKEKERVKGLIVNKFRGDRQILEPGIEMLETRCGKPVVGVVPYMSLDLEDEDSLSSSLDNTKTRNSADELEKSVCDNKDDKKEKNEKIKINIRVIRLPKISNFTDFTALGIQPVVDIKYTSKAEELDDSDLIILPGTKNTLADLQWLKEQGLAEKICSMVEAGCPVVGICGGFQMLGEFVSDPKGVESSQNCTSGLATKEDSIKDYSASSIEGMGLLPIETVFDTEKNLRQNTIIHESIEGFFDCLNETSCTGYEIHMGESKEKNAKQVTYCAMGNVFGTYMHGFFDNRDILARLLTKLAEGKKIDRHIDIISVDENRERELDKLADILRENIDLEAIYRVLEKSNHDLANKNDKKNCFEIIKPMEIEGRSFEIISSELGLYGYDDSKLDPLQAPIIKRCIHTSADFDYLKNLTFSQNAVDTFLEAIRNGASIVTDTQMAKAGINKKKLEQFGGQVYCFMSDEDVAEAAKKNGTTRAVASMDKVVSLGDNVIFAIGNAPTALVRLHELVGGGKISPRGIIGVPVGFVNVVPAKELILELEVPYIVARGRKGGSNIAAAICNALLKMV